MAYGYWAADRGLDRAGKLASACFAGSLFAGISVLLFAGVLDMVSNYGTAYALTSPEVAKAPAQVPVIRVVANRATECAPVGNAADKPT